MSTIRRIGLADFERLLAQWEPRRQITEFHLHCTDRPRRADFRGQATIEAMRAFHMGKGWSDIAQHLTVDPAGGLWTGRSWDSPPASAVGHNGTSRKGPFMIEVVGNFDKGKDPLDGEQRNAVIGVIVAVLRRFGLDEKALRFHRDFTTAKTCPGSSLDKAKMQAEIATILAAGGQGAEGVERRPESDAVLDTGEVRGWFDRQGARGVNGLVDDANAIEDPDSVEVPESDWALEEQEALAARLDLGPGVEGARRAPMPADALLRRHTINLSKGVLSAKGDIDSVQVTPKMIAERHLVDYLESRRQLKRPAHVVFYAHGGLVDEASAICYANTVLPWWLRNGVFPIFFIWESGFFETLRTTPRGAREFTDFTDWLLEGITQPVARRVWAEMKEDAGNASLSVIREQQGRAGGAWQLAQVLAPVLAKYPEVQLHAVGHSTGPILLSKFLPLLTDKGFVISTLSYLAPAIRTDRFLADVEPLIGTGKPIRELCMYTMNDEAERDDNCARIYRKSLLYFVREACGDRRVLGLQKDLYDDAELRKLFNLKPKDDGRIRSSNPPVTVEFSPPRGSRLMNKRTGALQHGGFDNDAQTMVSVLARVLGVSPEPTSSAMQFPPASAFKACGLGESTRAAPIAPASDDDYDGCCPCCRRALGRESSGGIDEYGRDGFGDDAESGAGMEPDEEPSGSASPPSPTGGDRRRIAVCIGIDQYADQPLQGCVNDSNRWAQALTGCGFTVRPLRDDQATRQAMYDALRRLVDEARSGDELVFQYSGHGAQLPDVSGDEDEKFDEAFVPFDYRAGQMLIDDDVRAITRALPEGATLTLFMDCCHSGTISRARARAASDGTRPRLMRFDDETVNRYMEVRGASKRSARRGGNASASPASASPGRGVAHFAACRDSEYAWESSGEGDFTRAAMAVFETAVREGWSNQTFIDAVIGELGTPARQHPRLWNPEPGLGKRTLLGGR